MIAAGPSINSRSRSDGSNVCGSAPAGISEARRARRTRRSMQCRPRCWSSRRSARESDSVTSVSVAHAPSRVAHADGECGGTPSENHSHDARVRITLMPTADVSTTDDPLVIARDVCVHYGPVVALAPTSFELRPWHHGRSGRVERQRQDVAAVAARRSGHAGGRHGDRRRHGGDGDAASPAPPLDAAVGRRGAADGALPASGPARLAGPRRPRMHRSGGRTARGDRPSASFVRRSVRGSAAAGARRPGRRPPDPTCCCSTSRSPGSTCRVSCGSST